MLKLIQGRHRYSTLKRSTSAARELSRPNLSVKLLFFIYIRIAWVKGVPSVMNYKLLSFPFLPSSATVTDDIFLSIITTLDRQNKHFNSSSPHSIKHTLSEPNQIRLELIRPGSRRPSGSHGYVNLFTTPSLLLGSEKASLAASSFVCLLCFKSFLK